MLNSHIDVVPVALDKWTHDPFGAELVDGFIYARGAQDMKCICVEYLEALRRILHNGEQGAHGGATAATATSPFLRTVHLIFTPDEEISGLLLSFHFTYFSEYSRVDINEIIVHVWICNIGL